MKAITSARLWATVCVLVMAAVSIGSVRPVHAAARTYYVDCAAGSDSNAGTSTTAAWKSISKVDKAALLPGDNVFLARGCTWSGTQLTAKWAGTSTAPITIGAYGTGAAPVIKNAGFANIKVTGSFQTIQDLYLTFDPLVKDPCGQPLGEYYGITFTTGAHDNTFRRSTSTAATAGVHLGRTSYANHILNNQLIGNNVLETFNDSTPADDLGAWGMVVISDGNEIAYNTFKNNAAVCTMPGQWLMSNSIEIYEGSNNSIHHNKSYGDRVFSELGGATVKPANNQYVYNLFTTARPDSRFIVTRGAGSPYGPVSGTVLNHNTTYQTGMHSQGVVCDLGCGPTILKVSGSIMWAEEKVVYADAPFDLSNSLVWNTAGAPVLQIATKPVLTNVVVANPLFVNAAGGNFALQSTSPAVDADPGIAMAAKDLCNTLVPQASSPDFGGYEYVAV